MQKECVICGDTFEAVRETRMYCDRCRKHPDVARRRVNRAITINKLNAGDYYKVFDRTCNYCGKNFKTSYLGRDFCSKHCEERFKIENTVCQYCGKPLYPEIESTGNALHPECKEPAYRAWAERKGWIRNCENCGVEYYAKSDSQRFCCKDCAQEYRKNHPQEYVSTRKEPEKQYRCAVCKKIFTTTINSFFENNPNQTTCSDRCKEICDKAYQKWLCGQKEKEKKSLEDEAKRKRQEDIENNGLCSICGTNYADCDLMKSKFKMKPKGAVYKNSKIVECPQFTEMKKGKK